MLEAATDSSLVLLGGSLKAEGFGDGFSLAKHILRESGNLLRSHCEHRKAMRGNLVSHIMQPRPVHNQALPAGISRVTRFTEANNTISFCLKKSVQSVKFVGRI